jgi:SH3-like domain-containing protein
MDQHAFNEAIVVAREVTARFGPLDESQSAFQLRDGAEVLVLDTKSEWIEIRDAEKRTGWIRREDTIVLPGALPVNRTQQAAAR